MFLFYMNISLNRHIFILNRFFVQIKHINYDNFNEYIV